MKQVFFIFFVAYIMLSSCSNSRQELSQSSNITTEQSMNTVQKTFWDCTFGDSWQDVKDRLTNAGFKNLDVNRNFYNISIGNVPFKGSSFEYATLSFNDDGVFNLISFHSTYDSFKDATELFNEINKLYDFKQVLDEDERFKIKYQYSDGDNTCEYFVFENRDSTYLAKLTYKNNALNHE